MLGMARDNSELLQRGIDYLKQDRPQEPLCLTVRCEWCETEATFDGPDPYAEINGAGWFVYTSPDEQDHDFCSTDCWLSSL
jgi:hypothetical protein